MISQKLKLATSLPDDLMECEELWVAVGLVSDYGFKMIQDNINPIAKQHYIIGIGLLRHRSHLASDHTIRPLAFTKTFSKTIAYFIWRNSSALVARNIIPRMLNVNTKLHFMFFNC